MRSELSPLELATSVITGENEEAIPLPRATQSLRQAVEAVLLEALAGGRCVIAFSGGRDSSVLLGLAVDCARRHGLALPIPYTMRFDASDTDESVWQEAVIRHLGLADWEIEYFTDELDLIGPFARLAIERHGLRWPANMYGMMPGLSLAAGGTLVTGLDGDGLFENWRYRSLVDLIRNRRRPRRSDLGLAVAALARRPRRAVLERRIKAELAWLDWLKPEAKDELLLRVRDDQIAEPPLWRPWVDWYGRRRYLSLVVESLELLASDAQARMVHPLLAPSVLAAAGNEFGLLGASGRTQVLGNIAADLVPQALISRSTKAEFTDAYWRPSSRLAAKNWNSEGLNTDVVDEAALSAQWNRPKPSFASALLFQSVFGPSH